MILRSDKGCIAYILISCLGLTVPSAMLLACGIDSVGLLLLAGALLFTLRFYAAIFRSVELSQDGVTLRLRLGRLLLWQKFHSWDWPTVRLESNGDRIVLGRCGYREAAVLEEKSAPRRILWRNAPVAYMIFVRPLSFLSLQFPESANFSGPHYYPVSKDELLARLSAWNVPISR